MSGDIPLISDNYSDDKIIIEYCSNNSDKKCGCVILSDVVLKIAKTSLTPVYCYCIKDDTFKTSLVYEEIKYCNLMLCEVHLSDIMINDGELNVKNDWIQLINPSISFSQNTYNTKTTEVKNMFVKNSFIIIFVALFLLVILYYGTGSPNFKCTEYIKNLLNKTLSYVNLSKIRKIETVGDKENLKDKERDYKDKKRDENMLKLKENMKNLTYNIGNPDFINAKENMKENSYKINDYTIKDFKNYKSEAIKALTNNK